VQQQRLLKAALLGLCLVGGASIASAQQGAVDQFNITVPHVLPAVAATGNGVTDVVIFIRNPNTCGTMKYNAYSTIYSDYLADVCLSPRTEFFRPTTVIACIPGPGAIAPGEVHRIHVPLATPFPSNAAPQTITIEYQGFAGAEAHLEGDVYIFSGDPTLAVGAAPTTLLGSFPLQRRGIR